MTHEFLMEVLLQAAVRVANLEALAASNLTTVREQATCDLLRLENATGLSSIEFCAQIAKWRKEMATRTQKGMVRTFYVMEPISRVWQEEG